MYEEYGCFSAEITFRIKAFWAVARFSFDRFPVPIIDQNREKGGDSEIFNSDIISKKTTLSFARKKLYS
jgi:hypothetical protein